MSKTTKTDMAAMMVGAQQAYAYLHGFHTRLGDTVMSLVKEIGTKLDLDLTFGKAQSLYTQHPSFRQNPYDRNSRWVWDWLPLYGFTSVFSAPKSEKYGTLLVEFNFEADTRRDGKSDSAPNLKKCDPDHTELTLFVWHNPEVNVDWKGSWSSSSYPEDDGVVVAAEDGFSSLRLDVNFLKLTDQKAIQIEAIKLVKQIKTKFKLTP